MTDHPHDKDCLAMFEKLSEYLDRELDELTCRDIERHLAACVPCKVCLQTLKRTVALCRNVEADPVPAALSGRVRDLIRQLSRDSGGKG
jgi:anti-sigma factor RsiW